MPPLANCCDGAIGGKGFTSAMRDDVVTHKPREIAMTSPPDPIAIRAITEADIPALVGMIDALSAHHGGKPQASGVTLARDLLGANPWAHARIAEVRGELAGYAIGCPLYFAQSGERGMTLHHLYIVPQYRGSGLGTRLTLAMRDMAVALGCTYLSVSAEPDNKSARQFYQSLGMRPSPVTGLRFAMDL